MDPDNIHGGRKSVAILCLQWRVTLPHTSCRSEGIDDSSYQGQHVKVRRLLATQSVERTDLEKYLRMKSHLAELLNFTFDKTILPADDRKMIDNYRSIRKPGAHAIDFREIGRGHEKTKCQTMLGGGGKHLVKTRMIHPPCRVVELRPRRLATNTKGVDSPLGQFHHRRLRTCQRNIRDSGHDASTHKSTRVALNDV